MFLKVTHFTQLFCVNYQIVSNRWRHQPFHVAKHSPNSVHTAYGTSCSKWHAENFPIIREDDGHIGESLVQLTDY